MGEIEQTLRNMGDLGDHLKGQVRDGNFLLVDLAGSTAFKTRQPEYDWLARLDAFYVTVGASLAPQEPTKYLGDGVFAFFEDHEVDAPTLLGKAREMVRNIEELNVSGRFPGDHAIRVRVILNSGQVYLLRNGDPQGTAVDKLFRMEKFVPDGHIGMTEEFVQKAGLTDLEPIGQFLLKGLAAGYHALYLDGITEENISQEVAGLKAQSEAAELWWLTGVTAQPVYLVGGYIPPEQAPSGSVQMGDKDALVEALYNLALAGDIQNIHLYDSVDFPDGEMSGNIVCIGGPCFNSVTLMLMEAAELPIHFEGLDEENDETPIVYEAAKQRFCKECDGQGRLVRDWGIFVHMKNPFNPEARVIIACGIESPAVSGIVKVFSPRLNPQFSKLYEHLINASGGDSRHGLLPEFCCIVRFQVEANGKTKPPSLTAQTRCIIPLNGSPT